jgi:hypothetical protein
MAKSNKERAELKKNGYVYDRHLQQWIHHEKQKEYYKKLEQSEQMAVWIMYILVFVVFIWFLIMANN